MSQKEELPLVGYIEICQRAGIRRPGINSWIQRYPEFPRPVATLQIGPVWWWPDVKEWLIKTGRRHDENWTVDQVDPRRKTRLRDSLKTDDKSE
ncbi:hypothetical protein GCM10010149_88510 [Nonomuraea roseoviolacea subsp. roseoviolacea]